MKPKCVLCCLSVVLSILLQGCIVIDRETVRGSRTVSQETRTFTGLTGVLLSTLGELDIRLGDKEELRIEADDNLLQYFETEKDGGVLRIGIRRGINLRPSRTVRYALTVKELEFIGLSSSGDAHAPVLSAGRFEIRISSSGDLSVDGIEAHSLHVYISSSGDVEIDEGFVDEQEIRISSSGDYDGESLHSGRATVRLSSSGKASRAV